jgi:hypothetical protein
MWWLPVLLRADHPVLAVLGGRAPEQQRADQLAPVMHELRPGRNAGQLRRVVQKRKPEPIGEYPVDGELIT